MHWEIRDMRDEGGIISAYVDNNAKRLNWDFVLGSPFDLCAVFPWDGIMALEDYQKKGVRPYLYHRQLKNYRSIAYDSEPHNYALYPAKLDQDKGFLYIGNRGCHVDTICKTKSKIVHIEFLKKILIFGPRPIKGVNLETEQAKLYYRIIKNKKLMDTVYEIDTNELFYIYLKIGEDVRFFSDRDCTKEINLTTYHI